MESVPNRIRAPYFSTRGRKTSRTHNSESELDFNGSCFPTSESQRLFQSLVDPSGKSDLNLGDEAQAHELLVENEADEPHAHCLPVKDEADEAQDPVVEDEAGEAHDSLMEIYVNEVPCPQGSDLSVEEAYEPDAHHPLVDDEIDPQEEHEEEVDEDEEEEIDEDEYEYENEEEEGQSHPSDANTNTNEDEGTTLTNEDARKWLQRIEVKMRQDLVVAKNLLKDIREVRQSRDDREERYLNVINKATEIFRNAAEEQLKRNAMANDTPGKVIWTSEDLTD